jgi:hypothetical protein
MTFELPELHGQNAILICVKDEAPAGLPRGSDDCQLRGGVAGRLVTRDAFSLTSSRPPPRPMLPTLLRRTACSTSSTLAPTTRSPIVWTFLPKQLPYALGLLLQESLVAARLDAKKTLLAAASTSSPSHAPSSPPSSRDSLAAVRRIANTDVLLLLEHTPVYTAGRRERDPVVAAAEAGRLGAIGADYISTMRGGQTTYHGPGQLVGYSLMDLAAAQVRLPFFRDRLAISFFV